MSKAVAWCDWSLLIGALPMDRPHPIDWPYRAPIGPNHRNPLAPEQDGALIAELSVRLRRRPDASSLQFILNVAQLLGQSAHNAPLLLPLLPMILHGMARHLESDGVQVCRRDLELDNFTRTAHALCLHSACTARAYHTHCARSVHAGVRRRPLR